MTKEEWIKERFIQTDLDYLAKCGFDVAVEENDNRYYPDQEYMVVITADNFSERIHNMRHLEIIVDVLKQYRRMNRGKKTMANKKLDFRIDIDKYNVTETGQVIIRKSWL